jgi:hypothetical protein
LRGKSWPEQGRQEEPFRMAGRLPTPQPQEEGLQSDQSEAGLHRPMPDWLENRQVPQSIKKIHLQGRKVAWQDSNLHDDN